MMPEDTQTLTLQDDLVTPASEPTTLSGNAPAPEASPDILQEPSTLTATEVAPSLPEPASAGQGLTLQCPEEEAQEEETPEEEPDTAQAAPQGLQVTPESESPAPLQPEPEQPEAPAPANE